MFAGHRLPNQVSSGAALAYGTRLYPSGRLAETNSLTHAARGLLTRRLEDKGPAFEVDVGHNLTKINQAN
jgi:hypothetical protein